jgi:hypothetical protein
MDVFYHVKQLMLEIATLEAQLREKKSAIDKLFAVLTPQEKLILDLPATSDSGVKPSEPVEEVAGRKAPKKA